MNRRDFWPLIMGALALATTLAARPVEFRFAPAGGAGAQPLAREVWAEVTTPRGRTLRLPAYWAGDGVFAVRARAEDAGEYRLGAITETSGGGAVGTLDCRVTSKRIQRVSPQEVEQMPQVGLDRDAPERFVTSDGKSFAPLGANLAWAESSNRTRWYAKALHGFAQAELNWARIWMASWGGLDLSWLPEDMGPSPAVGMLDERVAENWDHILASAEKEGVYVQLVLQHHGQWSSQVNPNWKGNPWNAENPGGFLKTAGEFFTSEKAQRLTKQKYRTIVARWGYSPAIMAWELFNEVHWVDALRLEHNEGAVAAWHDEMATYLRSLDVYGHLVTTSTEDLASPIYRSMDYYQPHLYPSEPIPAARRHDPLPGDRVRPVFYGEQGDDHLKFSAAQKDSGVEMLRWCGRV